MRIWWRRCGKFALFYIILMKLWWTCYAGIALLMLYALLALYGASPLVTNGFSSWGISRAHDMSRLWKTWFISHDIDETYVDLKLYDERFLALLAPCVEFPLAAGGLSLQGISGALWLFFFFFMFSCMGYWTNNRIASDMKSLDAHVISLLLIFSIILMKKDRSVVLKLHTVTDDKLYYPRFNNRIHKFSLVYATPANNQQHWYIFYKF